MKKECEEKWAINKYLVLSKSQKIYFKIREYLKNEKVNIYVLNAMIEDALILKEEKREVVNAYKHIWGYFKKYVNEDEKVKFLKYIDEYIENKKDKEEILMYLKLLLKKYPNKYLENSNIFQKGI